MIKIYKSFYSLLLFFIFFNPFLFSQIQVCSEVVENQNSVISCPENGSIESVDFDSYGRPVGNCGNYQISDCHCAPNTNNWIGTNSQTVNSNNGLCGDPCEHSTKRRYIQISCSVEGCTNDNAVNLSLIHI